MIHRKISKEDESQAYGFMPQIVTATIKFYYVYFDFLYLMCYFIYCIMLIVENELTSMHGSKTKETKRDVCKTR